MNDNLAKDFDVAIAGGGPAGSSAAIQLALAGARVLLVEQKKFPRPKLCGEFISPECLSHFQRLGVATAMLAAGGTAITTTVFYARNGASVHLPSEWFKRGTAALGLSRSEMDHRLLDRAKEVGVRKVMGASVSQIMGMMSREFVKLVLLSFVIATPIAWYAMNAWLQAFEYKITLDISVFIFAGMGALAIALLTISYESLRAANADPARTLRNE